jgi:hypothetical protein
MAGVWRRAVKVALPVLAVAAVGLVVPSYASGGVTANGCTRHGSAAGRTVDAASIGAATAEMVRSGKTEDEIDRIFAAEWCVRFFGRQPVTPAGGADSEDITMSSKFAYDQYSGATYAVFSYHWLNHDYASDAPVWMGCDYSTGIGGGDGVALRLSGGEYRLDQYYAQWLGDWGLDQYDGDYGNTWTRTPSQANQYGVGFTMQDNVKFVRMFPLGPCTDHVDFDRYWSEVVVKFQPLNGGCLNTQIFGDYTHTWSSTALTGIGAGVDGFSFSWQDEGHDFNASHAGATAQICAP